MTGRLPQAASSPGAGGDAAAAVRDPLYGRGMAWVMLAGCFWSLGGILIRTIETATDWQIVLYRSIALALTIFAVLAMRHRRRVFDRFRRVGATGSIGALCLAGARSVGAQLA